MALAGVILARATFATVTLNTIALTSAIVITDRVLGCNRCAVGNAKWTRAGNCGNACVTDSHGYQDCCSTIGWVKRIL